MTPAALAELARPLAPDVVAGYLELVRRWDEEFARGRARHGERLQCRKGCSDCCSQLFQVTELEAAVVAAHVAALPGDVRDALGERAVRYLEARARLRTADGEAESWGRLPVAPAAERPACPALTADGACGIYVARPLICRKYGVPLYDPERGTVSACPKNFADGDAIDDPDLVAVHTALRERWRALEARYDASGGRRVAEPLCVGSALVAGAAAARAGGATEDPP